MGPRAARNLHGGGPCREVQVTVDGRPAGLAQPYPVVHSGGTVPTLWRPIPAIEGVREALKG
ncbi:peptide-N4-asparagine amidase [Streptomyces sp. NPDC057565]|uniref:peptide-N4-asparagine amidase n=1 Tax=Streptomyces sp. NPDC057565 TaxID=3346169 RepID=UPI003694C766